ncbi:MAG: hypothetical protein K8R88_09430 [Armatimonadetes bacterium]|nr:hypothetical protein [Armatimonadota bacterium]
MALIKTASFLDGIGGSTGNTTYIRTRYGTSLRDRTAPRDKKTPAQMEARLRMKLVGIAWRKLTIAQANLWREYASRQSAPALQQPFPANVYFNQLGLKFLQVNPDSPLPLEPPATSFGGDGLTATATAVSGGIQITASQANTPGVVTEILLQPMRTVHRRAYEEKYRTAEFVGFGPSLTTMIPAVPGVYAVAIRFTRAATGQAGGLVELGMLEV